MSNKDKINLVDGKYSIRDLVDLEELRKIFESFTLATGFTIGFLEHPSLEILIATGWRDICTKFHRAYPESIEYCLESNKKLIGKLKRPGQLIIEECENGLVDCATPIIIKGEHLASLATGQVLLKKPDIKWFKKKAQTHGYDVEKYLEALNEVLIVPRKKLKHTTSFLSELAVFIADLGLNNLEIKETAVILEAEITERKQAKESLKEREALLQLQFERMPIGCITWDLKFRVVSWNPAAEKIFGFTEEEAKGKHPYDIIVPKDAQPLVDTIWQRLIEGDITAHSENENITKDGGIINCYWVNTPLKYADGKVIGVISMVQDISERKRAEEEIKILSSVVQQSTEGMAIASLDGKLTFVNEAWCKMHGYNSPKELLGKSLTISHNQEQIENDVKPFNEKVMELGAYSGEVGHITKGGKPFPTLMVTTLLTDKQGKPYALAGIAKDITERKQAEKEIIKRVKELEEFYDMAVGRELRMVELKKQIEKLEVLLKKHGVNDEGKLCQASECKKCNDKSND